MSVNPAFDMQPSSAMICMQGSSDGESEETEGRKMKCLTNNIFLSECGGTDDNANLSLFVVLLLKELNLHLKLMCKFNS